MEGGSVLVFYRIGKFSELVLYDKNHCVVHRTAAVRNYVAEATRRRRRILQGRILSYVCP